MAAAAGEGFSGPEGAEHAGSALARVRWGDMMLGIAIGDSVGAGLEFKSREWLEEHVDWTGYVNTGDGMWAEGFKEGQYTDDTEMTIGLVKALINTKDLNDVNEDALLRYWADEYNLGKERYGKGRLGHGSIEWAYESKNSIEDIRRWQSERAYPGNAPVMRCLPLGFLPEEHLERICIVNANATHPHPKSRAATILMARGVRYVVLEHGPEQDIIRNCSQGIAEIDQETSDYLKVVDKLPDPRTEASSSMTTVEALCGPQPLKNPFDGSPAYGLNSDAMRTAGCALYLLKWYTKPLDGLKAAVRMGGYSDSLAAVVLGTLGARHGLEGIAPAYLDSLEDREQLQALGVKFGARMHTVSLANL